MVRLTREDDIRQEHGERQSEPELPEERLTAQLLMAQPGEESGEDSSEDSGSSEDMCAVVIDNGIRTIKVGFSGDDRPTATFPAIIGRGRHVYFMVGMEHKDYWVGHEAWSKRGVLQLKHPMNSLGLVTDWEDMENIWRHAFYNEARVAPEESPVLMTEAVLNPKANRERMVQICFETFDVPAFYVCTRAALALFATSSATGIILQVSAGEPIAIPFYEGHAIVNSVLASHCMKGCQLDDLMGKLLSDRGYALCGSLETTEIFGRIKQQLGYVALDPKAEMQKPERSTTDFEKAQQLLEFSKVTHARLGAATGIHDIENDLSQAVAIHCRHDVSAWFMLSPEQAPIRVGHERFRCAEALFHPKLICGEDADGGVHELIYNSVRSCDAGIRSDLLRNIICQGGHARFPGFRERLELEITHLVAERGIGLETTWSSRVPRPADAAQLRVGKPQVVVAEAHSAWCGGSTMSSASSFASRWISKADYDDQGPTLVHQCCC
eukprot:SAG31_NODE_112_length_24420_cov_19.787550_11_plen_496_part_00